MSDETNEFDSNENESKQNWRRDLENRAKAGDEATKRAADAEQEALAARRELAMIKAGINAESGPGKFFADHYTGDLTGDALVTAAREAGALPSLEIPADQQAAQQRVQAAMQGAPADGSAPSFQANLDSIPMLVNGQWNPDYQRLVLNATREQAALEGKEFSVVSDGAVTFADGYSARSGVTPR